MAVQENRDEIGAVQESRDEIVAVLENRDETVAAQENRAEIVALPQNHAKTVVAQENRDETVAVQKQAPRPKGVGGIVNPERGWRNVFEKSNIEQYTKHNFESFFSCFKQTLNFMVILNRLLKQNCVWLYAPLGPGEISRAWLWVSPL